MISDTDVKSCPWRGATSPQPPPPLSLCPSISVTATGRPWQPQTLMLSLRSSSPSSAVSKSCPSHKGKLLVYNRPRHDVRFCGLMVNEAHVVFPRWRCRSGDADGARQCLVVFICWSKNIWTMSETLHISDLTACPAPS